jgi:PhzF family phenazine biosynthesis protein
MPIILAYGFTDRPFAGNRAAAVLDADRLDNVSMQRIAAELRVAATAFVSTPIPGDADWRLRMFTPIREVGYSGHTALCGTHALIEAGRVPEGHVTFTTPAGLVDVEVEQHHGPALMWLEPASDVPPFRGRRRADPRRARIGAS